jgi:ADP-ribosylglycohydrolase
MEGGGAFGLKPGEWTDDTSMALCLAESLVERGDFDPVDQLKRYVAWYRQGKWSSTGRCFDIGNTTRAALERFEQTGERYCGSRDEQTAGNGSLMRLAPAPLFFAEKPEIAIDESGESSRTTHGARTCIDACRYFGALLVGAVQGRSKDDLLGPQFTPVPGFWKARPLHEEVQKVALGSFRRKSPPSIRGTGYVVDSLEAALWAFFHSASFEEAILKAVNLGDDADTTGAICGQIAGAYYGEGAIPSRWLEKIVMRSEIASLAGRLLD